MAELLTVLSALEAGYVVAAPILKTVRQLYNAPKEVTALQDQSNAFHSLLRAVKGTRASCNPALLLDALIGSQSVVDAMREFLAINFRAYPTKKMSCRTGWARHRRQFARFRQRLIWNRKRLKEALLLDACVTAHRCTELLTAGESRDFEDTLSYNATDDFGSLEYEPYSRFEVLPSFRPELCGSTVTTPRVFTYCIQEIEGSVYSRKSTAAMFYLSAPRRWMRVTATIETREGSPYWQLTGAGTVSAGAIGYHSLPTSLNLRVAEFLATQNELVQDSELRILLDNNFTTIGSQIDHSPRMQLTNGPPADTGIRHELRNPTESVAQSGLPWYHEAQLHMHPLHRAKKPDYFFIVWLEGRWMLACRFGSEKAHLKLHIYNFKVLYSLRNSGSSGVAKLQGVFSDDTRTGIINGFICELPSEGRIVRILSDARKMSGESVSMQRKVGWCRDLVGALADIHRNGYTIGSMYRQGCGIGINDEDHAVFYNRFSPHFEVGGARAGILPPEYWAANKKCLPATFRTDMYHLGFLLWRILEDDMPGRRCKIECTNENAEPITLPHINQDVPEFMREVISNCRSENPAKRLPATKLLEEMFPAETTEDRDLRPRSNSRHLTDQQEVFRLYGNNTVCDRCGVPTIAHYYHCNFCGDYDICPGCFNAGIHCLSGDHWLREDFAGKDKDTYWSSRGVGDKRQSVTV